MIAPDMATMLCFMFTDAAMQQPALQAWSPEGRPLQLHDRGRRYLDQRHLPAVCHRRCSEARAAGSHREAGDPALAEFSAALTT